VNGGKGRTGNSKLNQLGEAEGVVDLDAEIADGAFELRMSEEELYGSKVALTYTRRHYRA
jgi:hypothetical protein